MTEHVFTYRDFLGIALVATGVYLFAHKKQVTSKINNLLMPRGYRNNNPLNIRINNANNWKGRKLPNTDGAFEQFISMPYGYRAAIITLQNYIRSGYNTLEKIINRWAPSDDNNDPNGYMRVIYQETGYAPKATFTATDKQGISNLIYAMAIVENGRTIMPDRSQIAEAWEIL